MILSSVTIPKTSNVKSAAIMIRWSVAPLGPNSALASVTNPLATAAAIPTNQLTRVSPVCPFFQKESAK